MAENERNKPTGAYVVQITATNKERNEEMFTIIGGEYLKRWEKDREIQVNDSSVDKVYFTTKARDGAVEVEVFGGIAKVPNGLLQQAHDITVYGYVGDKCKLKVLAVKDREKPEDYYYYDGYKENVENIESGIAPKALDECIREMEDIPNGGSGTGSGGGGEYFETVQGTRICWDGNTDGLPSVMVDLGEEMGGEVPYYKVSDVMPLPASSLAKYSIVATTIMGVNTENMNLSQAGMVITSGTNTFFYLGVAILDTTTEIMGTIFPEIGVWLTPAMFEGRLILEFGHPGCEFKSTQLKPEHLPNNDFIVTLTGNEEMTMTTDKNFSDIEMAIASGKNLIIKVYDLAGGYYLFRDYIYSPETSVQVNYIKRLSASNNVSVEILYIERDNTVRVETVALG